MLSWGKRALLVACVVAPTLAAAPPSAKATTVERVIVVVDAITPPRRAANAFAKATGGRVVHVYEHVMRGFAVEVREDSQLPLLSGVRAILRDSDAKLTVGMPFQSPNFVGGLDKRQMVDPAIRRIGADASSVRAGDGAGPPVDADIAIMDTGIDETHPDLSVAGGVDCSDSARSRVEGYQPWHDVNGHGTGMAGIAAAKDNRIGVVGAAPGARLWAIKVVNPEVETLPGQSGVTAPPVSGSGVGFYGNLLCGLDWVARHAARIEVVSASLGFLGRRLRPCNGQLDAATDPRVYKAMLSTHAGRFVTTTALTDLGKTDAGDDMLHEAFCTVVNKRKVPIAVSAGNGSIAVTEGDYQPILPAAFPEVMAVSALVDFDGKPGSAAGKQRPCGVQPWPATRSQADDDGPVDGDDTFADFSVFGREIALIAPGVCVTSTEPHGRYFRASGTSEATPLVAAAAALYRVRRPGATPAEVKLRLLQLGTYDWDAKDDPDHLQEPLLNLRSL